MPTCPACKNQLGWKHSFSFWNPWNYPCPHCKVPLEASRIQKCIAYAVVPAGLLIAAVPIIFERSGMWKTQDSLLFFAILVPLIVIGALASWPLTTFTVKRNES